LPLFLTLLAGAFLPVVFAGSAGAFLPGAFLPGAVVVAGSDVVAGSAAAFLAGAFLPGGSAGAFLPGVFAGRGGAFRPDAVGAAGGDVVAGSGVAFLAGALVGSGSACLAGAGSDDAALVRLRGRRGVCSSPIRTRVVRVSPSHRARSAGKTTKILLSPVQPTDQVQLVPVSGAGERPGYPLCPVPRGACILDRRRP
jgi:hypothetical protein